MPSEGEPTGQLLAGPAPPSPQKNTTTQKTTLGVRQCLELSAGALTTLLWKGPMLWWPVECSEEGALGYEGLTGYNSLLF